MVDAEAGGTHLGGQGRRCHDQAPAAQRRQDPPPSLPRATAHLRECPPTRHLGQAVAEHGEGHGIFGAHGHLAVADGEVAQALDDRRQHPRLEVEEEGHGSPRRLDRLLELEQAIELGTGVGQGHGAEVAPRGEALVVHQDDGGVGGGGDVDLEEVEIQEQGTLEVGSHRGPGGAMGGEAAVSDPAHPPIIPRGPYHGPVLRRLVLFVAATLAAACGGGGSSPPPRPPAASPSPAATPPSVAQSPVPVPVAGRPPRDGVPWYLAVGDSITFGSTVDPSRAGVNSSWALQLQGLLAASQRPWSLYDTACPGETTTTYFTRCPGRDQVPFLSTVSQHDVDVAAITGHRADLRFIAVDLGSNDLLRARQVGEDPLTAAARLRTNLGRILDDLIAAAPAVPLVVLGYYDPYANAAPATVSQLALVNGVVRSVAREHQARFVDVAAVINTAPPPDPHLGDYVDLAHHDVHPTVAGHAAIARAVLAALG